VLRSRYNTGGNKAMNTAPDHAAAMAFALVASKGETVLRTGVPAPDYVNNLGAAYLDLTARLAASEKNQRTPGTTEACPQSWQRDACLHWRAHRGCDYKYCPIRKAQEPKA
jgi:hypothetical protein